MTCLEMMLFRAQAERYPMVSHPTELGAFVLRRAGALRIVVSSSDQPGLKLRRTVIERIDADLDAGWSLLAHFHNHPFMFAKEDIAGALAPSLSDVSVYRALARRAGLQAAWLTNGFETIRLSADFARLPARERPR